MPYEKFLLRNEGKPNSRAYQTYVDNGGYQGVRKALAMTSDELVDYVKGANLRGRGGAGFPAGVKWSFLPKDRTTTFLCVNCDESEPPTFSNRHLMEVDPHQIVEGCLIAAYATRASVIYYYMRGEFIEQFHIMQKAVDEAYENGWFGKDVQGSGFDCDFYVHRGAGAYICGEETGLIESLEGKRGWPRIKPPFPAVKGAFGEPTVVNNVETLANLPHIMERGVDWWMGLGPKGSEGTKLYCICGPVNKPGTYEAPCGVTVRELIYSDDFGGGTLDNRKVKAVAPGGISMGFLRGETFPQRPDGDDIDPNKDYDELDCRLDFDDVRNYGLLGLGTAAAVVIDESIDVRDVLTNITRFFSSESCGQCTHCREGTTWAYKIAQRIRSDAGRLVDLDLLVEMTRNMGMMPGMNICGLSDGAAWPIRTLITKFRAEFEQRIKAQSPDAAERKILTTNPAAYSLPIAQGRAVATEGGTTMPYDMDYFEYTRRSIAPTKLQGQE